MEQRITLYLIEEDSQENLSETYFINLAGYRVPILVEIGDENDDLVLYDLKYGGDEWLFEHYYEFGEDWPDYYTYLELDKDLVSTIKENCHVNSDAQYKSYDM